MYHISKQFIPNKKYKKEDLSHQIIPIIGIENLLIPLNLPNFFLNSTSKSSNSSHSFSSSLPIKSLFFSNMFILHI